MFSCSRTSSSSARPKRLKEDMTSTSTNSPTRYRMWCHLMFNLQSFFCEVELLFLHPFRQLRSEWQRTSATVGCALRSGFAEGNPRIRSSYRPVLERWRPRGPASSARSCGGRPYETEVREQRLLMGRIQHCVSKQFHNCT